MCVNVTYLPKFPSMFVCFYRYIRCYLTIIQFCMDTYKRYSLAITVVMER